MPQQNSRTNENDYPNMLQNDDGMIRRDSIMNVYFQNNIEPLPIAEVFFNQGLSI